MNRESDRQTGELADDADRLPQLLRRLLDELDGIERRAVVGGASRRLIQHGRSLDSLLSQAHGQWKEYNRQPDAGTLDALCHTLVAAHEDAEQLKLALQVTSAPLEASASDRPRAGVPGPQPSVESEPGAGIDEVRHRIRDLLDTLEQRLSAASRSPETADETAPASSPEPDRARSAESTADVDPNAVDGMLWKITSDWQHLQRAPSPDRIELLCDKLERASEEVRRLAADIEDVSRRTLPDAAIAPPSDLNQRPFRDPMTGSLSREGFDVLVIGELKRSRRYRRPFTLLLVEAPDSEPRTVAELLERLIVGLRGSDFVGHYVDRLIAVGLPETSSDAAVVAARRVIRSAPAGSGGEVAPKFGLASLPEDGRTLAELAALARRKLRDGSVSLSEAGGDYWGV